MITLVSGSNFRSYEDVELVFGSQRVSIVYGDSESDYADSNGTGKTTLMYLVLWTLYGKWPGMESAESCLRQPHGKDCCGSLTIQKPDGQWRVERYRKHRDHKNNVYVYAPGSPTPISGDMKVVQERIESLVGMNYDTFSKTMVYTGAEGETFAKMTDKQQKALLDTIVPMDFQPLHEKAKEKVKFAEETCNECNGVVRSVEQWMDRNTMEQESLKAEIAMVKAQEAPENQQHLLEDARKRVAELEDAIRGYESKRAALSNWLDKLERERDGYRPTLEWFENAEEKLITYRAANAFLMDAEKRHAQYTKSINHELKLLTQRLVNDQQGKTCHTCGQALGEEALAKAIYSTQADIQRVEQEKAKADQHYAAQTETHATKRRDTLLDDESAAKLKQDIVAAKAYWKELLSKIEDLTRQDREVERTAKATHESKTAWESVVREYEDAIASADNPTKKQEGRLTFLVDEHERLVGDLVAAKENQKEWGETAAMWVDVMQMFSGGKNSLQHFLFESMLPEMTATAQMFLSLFSQNELSVAFKSHKKKGSKTVEGFFIEAAKGANTKGYGDMSGGERRRIDLCIFLTLHLLACKHVFSPGVVFLDEIADFMDDTGQQQVVSVLEFLCQQYNVSCLLLTNKRELVASVAHGYRCSMIDGTSQLVSIQET